jgi:predicted secreted Zn-dependent protease
MVVCFLATVAGAGSTAYAEDNVSRCPAIKSRIDANARCNPGYQASKECDSMRSRGKEWNECYNRIHGCYRQVDSENKVIQEHNSAARICNVKAQPAGRLDGSQLTQTVEVREAAPYDIRGTTAAELIAQMKSLGPKIKKGRAFAATEWSFPFLHIPRETKKGFVYSRTVWEQGRSPVILQTYPNWRNFHEAPKCLQAQWSVLMGQMRRHEQEHVDILRANSARVVKALRSIPPQETKEQIYAEMKRVSDQVQAEIIAEQEKLDHPPVDTSRLLLPCAD